MELFGPGKGRDRKLKGLQQNARCPECQRKHTIEVNTKMGLVADIRLNTIGNMLAPSLGEEIAFVFSGDSFNHKEELKSMGAIYTNNYPGDGFIKDLLSASPRRKCWVLFCPMTEYEETFAKVNKIATIKSLPSSVDITFFHEAKKQQLQKANCLQKELSELGPIPAWPDEFKALITFHLSSIYTAG